MLKRLLNRLHIIMTGILMVLITLILSFTFWNTYQSAQTADVTYIQRMASLIIYQLEADTEQPETVLSDYEEADECIRRSLGFRRFAIISK